MRVKIFIFHKWRRQSTFICLILVLQWIKREITIIINILHAWKGGWCWRSPKEVHWPQAHFSVMHSSKWGKTHFKKQLLRSIFPFVKKQPPLVLLQQTWAEVMDIAKRRAKNGSWRALRFLLWSPQVFITPPVCLYGLRSSPFLRQMRAHPRKLLRAATCRKNVQRHTAFPTTTFLWTPSPPLTTTPQTNEHP